MSDKDKLDEAKERFKLSLESESENREWALDDLKFARMGEQWPERIRLQRESEGRPCLTINRLPAFARQVVNDARQNKPSIRVRPADSEADPKTAEIYNGLIRNIEQSSNADVAYDTALESAVYTGFGYFRIKTDYAHDDTFDLDILIERVANPFTVFGDPLSQAADASDWRYGFVTELMPIKQFKAEYKGADTSDWSADGDDKDSLWRTEDTVRVAEYWSRSSVMKPIVQLSSGLILEAKQYTDNRDIFDAQGITVIGERETRSYQVKQCIMTGAEILEEKDWSGRYIPIIPCYGDEVNVEGKRYFRSLIRDVRDAQTMYNFWRTSTAELVALAPKAPFIGPKGSFDGDMGRWQTAHVKSHPFMEYDGPVMPQRQPFAGVPAGAMQEALTSSDDMKSILGIYDASLGARSNETSGRAIMARQREGDVATFHFIDNLSRAIRYAGRVLIDLIPTVYDKPRMLRVLGEDGAVKVQQVNAPDPHGHVYELARGKYDLVVETGPSFTTKREEASTFLLETIRANPATAPLLMDVVASNLDFPSAEKIAKRFKAMLPPQIQSMENDEDGEQTPDVLMSQLAQAQQQLQQMGQQMQAMQSEQQVKLAEVQAEREKQQAELQLEREKAQAEIQLAREKAIAEMELKRASMTGDMQLKRLNMRADATLKQQQSREQAKTTQAKVGASLRNGDPLDTVVASTVEASMAESKAETRQIAQILAQGMQQMSQQQAAALAQALQSINAPKELVRDPVTGKAIGVRPVQGA
jgi:hypothetical protein